MRIAREYYVYIYCDPSIKGHYTYPDIELTLTTEPFYVGKGKGNRDVQHITEVRRRSNKGNNWYKYQKIKGILKQGKEPIIVKLKEHLNENQALELEMKSIKTIGRKNLSKSCGPRMIFRDGVCIGPYRFCGFR